MLICSLGFVQVRWHAFTNCSINVHHVQFFLRIRVSVAWYYHKILWRGNFFFFFLVSLQISTSLQNVSVLCCNFTYFPTLFCIYSSSLWLRALNITCDTSLSLPIANTYIYMQQVPEEIESVMVGIEAYLSIKRHNSDTGLSFFEDDDDESGSDVVEKVLFLCY